MATGEEESGRHSSPRTTSVGETKSLVAHGQINSSQPCDG